MPKIVQKTNKAKSTATIVDPTGVPATKDIIIPNKAQNTDEAAAKIVTLLKFLKIFIADTAGKIINAEIKSDPTRFIAKTIMIAIKTAMIKLYAKTFVPDV